MYPNTFAGLVQAAVDAGVPGQAIEEMEARGVSSLETARQALDRGLVSEQLQAYLQALVATAFAFGQQKPQPRSSSYQAGPSSASPQQWRIHAEGSCGRPAAES